MNSICWITFIADQHLEPSASMIRTYPNVIILKHGFYLIVWASTVRRKSPNLGYCSGYFFWLFSVMMDFVFTNCLLEWNKFLVASVHLHTITWTSAYRALLGPGIVELWSMFSWCVLIVSALFWYRNVHNVFLDCQFYSYRQNWPERNSLTIRFMLYFWNRNRTVPWKLILFSSRKLALWKWMKTKIRWTFGISLSSDVSLLGQLC